MKQFDEEFSRKAKEAFDNYNADHLAGEGWNSYIEKYGKKRTKALIIPLWARVASVAAILTIIVLLTNRINHRQAEESGNKLAQENRSELTESAINKEDTAAARPVISNPDQASEATIGKTGESRPTGREKTDYQVNEHAGSVLAEAGNDSRSVPAKTDKDAGSGMTEIGKDTRSVLAVTGKAARSSASETVNTDGSLVTDTSLAAESILSEPFTADKLSAWMNLPDNPLEIRITEDADTRLKLKPEETLYVYGDIPREKMTTTLMTGLSGMMASIDNATSASQGVSFGFYVEQQLTRRISIRPGLAMAKHNYAMESVSGGSVAQDYAAPELNGLSDATTLFEGDIEVVSMEVPVNFVFSLRKRSRSNLFVTTGASTVIYLNQHLSGNFNNTYTRSTVDAGTGQVSYESMTTSVRIESEQEPLNRVDLLGLANFSAGYSIPFGKTSHLLFEPFVQLPLKDLTSLDMRIRYGGLSMKIQF